MLDLQKVPHQAFLTVPAESVSAIINVKVDIYNVFHSVDKQRI